MIDKHEQLKLGNMKLEFIIITLKTDKTIILFIGFYLSLFCIMLLNHLSSLSFENKLIGIIQIYFSARLETLHNTRF